MHFYKALAEASPSEIVQSTVDGLLAARCVYRFARVRESHGGLPAEGRQAAAGGELISDVDWPLDEATAYAINDVEFLRSTTRRTARWPRITLVFERDFRFDSKVKALWTARTAREVRQVTLHFQVNQDPLFGERVTIALRTWYDYVLEGGRAETHIFNKRQVVKIAASVCDRVHPHFGWADGSSPADRSYPLLLAGQWPVENDLVAIGPQLMARIAAFRPEASPALVSALDNGGVILGREAGGGEPDAETAG
jgi:hypothetical protein